MVKRLHLLWEYIEAGCIMSRNYLEWSLFVNEMFRKFYYYWWCIQKLSEYAMCKQINTPPTELYEWDVEEMMIFTFIVLNCVRERKIHPIKQRNIYKRKASMMKMRTDEKEHNFCSYSQLSPLSPPSLVTLIVVYFIFLNSFFFLFPVLHNIFKTPDYLLNTQPNSDLTELSVLW